jgi:hypothetical protein
MWDSSSSLRCQFDQARFTLCFDPVIGDGERAERCEQLELRRQILQALVLAAG